MKGNNSKSFPQKHYYIYGKHPVICALNNPNRTILNIWCSQSVYKENQGIINQFSYQIVTDDYLTRLLANNSITHQGIVAKAKPIFLNNLDKIDVKKDNYKIAILDQVSDPQNVGSIIRSAVAFNFDIIILPQDNSPEESGTICKASSGMIETIPIIKVVNIKNVIDFLKKNGFWIIGLDAHGSDKINNSLFKNKIGIVLGSEGSGMRQLTKKNCDFLIKIPINEKVESLNVANAASIIFYLSNM